MIEKKIHPYLRENKEYESNIGEYRIAIGMTVKELADLCETTIGGISNLQNGITVPYYLNTTRTKNKTYNPGDIKPHVEKMKKIFEERLGIPVSYEDMFPRYSCGIERNKIHEGVVPFTESQLEDFYGSIEKGIETRLILKETFREALDYLTPREREIINLRFYKNLTQMETGEEFSLTNKRVQQIENKALRKLRRFF